MVWFPTVISLVHPEPYHNIQNSPGKIQDPRGSTYIGSLTTSTDAWPHPDPKQVLSALWKSRGTSHKEAKEKTEELKFRSVKSQAYLIGVEHRPVVSYALTREIPQ